MLMRAICGLIMPTAGQIDINGEVLHKDIQFPKSIGALIENPAFILGYTGFKNLKMIAEIGGKADPNVIDTALCDVGLDTADKRSYRKYSLGMKQKLGIACAIMGSPDIVILDEPFNALDEQGVKLLRAALLGIKARGGIAILACHDKDELFSISDVIIKMESGRIITDEDKKTS